MANKNSSKKQNQEREFFAINGMKVSNVRKIPGTSVISFSLLGHGLGLYNLKIVKGSNGEFIAAPSSKGKDGNYYAQYAVYLSEEDQKKVIGVVKSKLPDDEDEPDPDVDF